MVEHLPDLVAAFLEWNRLLVHGGCVFMIFPKRDALPEDAGRPISTLDEIITAWREQRTVDTWDYEANPVPGGRRGHYWVFTLDLMLQLVRVSNAMFGLDWRLLQCFETDDKVGNGHLAVFEVNHAGEDCR